MTIDFINEINEILQYNWICSVFKVQKVIQRSFQRQEDEI